MRVLLAGQRSFGVAAFDTLRRIPYVDIVAVWSPDDIPKGQPFAEWSDPLTRLSCGSTWVPKAFRTPEEVAKQRIDMIVAAHSHDFISRPVRQATRLGGIGYHPSLLPRHRGRDAVRWTIHMGDPITGGTVYWLTDNIDGGPVAAQEHCFVHPNDDASSLWREKLFPLGLELLSKVVSDVRRNTIIEIPQDEAYATWEPSWERPPLFRPDLPQIGNGIPGMKHITRKEAVMGAGAKASL